MQTLFKGRFDKQMDISYLVDNNIIESHFHLHQRD